MPRSQWSAGALAGAFVNRGRPAWSRPLRERRGHLPERYGVAHYAPPPPPDARHQPRKSRGLLAVRVFRPPIPVEVITPEANGDKQIASIHGDGDISGSVRVSSGPWRIEHGWWTEAPSAREYWDVELERGGVYRVYQASASADWFVDARYD